MLAIISLKRTLIPTDNTVIPIKMQEDCLDLLTTLNNSQLKVIESLYPITAYFKAGTAQNIELILYVNMELKAEEFDRIYSAIKRSVLLTLKETGNTDQYKLANLELSNDQTILQANMSEAKKRLTAFLTKVKAQNDEEKKSTPIPFSINNIEKFAEGERFVSRSSQQKSR